jgi:hypothetical protein
MSDPTTYDRCAGCGAQVPGGTEGCWKLFREILVLEYSDPAYGAVHHLTIDAHALQHTEVHGPRSNAFHLLRLCMLLEYGGEPGLGQNAKWPQTSLNGYSPVPFLEVPQERGAVTVADVHGATSPNEHAERVYDWARSVWEAYRNYHDWARRWLRDNHPFTN